MAFPFVAARIVLLLRRVDVHGIHRALGLASFLGPFGTSCASRLPNSAGTSSSSVSRRFDPTFRLGMLDLQQRLVVEIAEPVPTLDRLGRWDSCRFKSVVVAFIRFAKTRYSSRAIAPSSLDTMYGINARWRLPSRKGRDRERSPR